MILLPSHYITEQSRSYDNAKTAAMLQKYAGHELNGSCASYNF